MLGTSRALECDEAFFIYINSRSGCLDVWMGVVSFCFCFGILVFKADSCCSYRTILLPQGCFSPPEPIQINPCLSDGERAHSINLGKLATATEHDDCYQHSTHPEGETEPVRGTVSV